VGDAIKHGLLPKHSKVSQKERDALLEQFQVRPQDLPKILKTDAAIAHLDCAEGDIIKIVRESKTAGESVFYRTVI